MNKFLMRRVVSFYLMLGLFSYFATLGDWFSGLLMVAILSLLVFYRELGEWARVKYPTYWTFGNALYDRMEAKSDKIDENVSKWLDKKDNKPPQNLN